MKKIFTVILLLLSITVYGQSWQQTGNTLQRRIVSLDTSYRFSLGAQGFMYLYTKPQIDTKITTVNDSIAAKTNRINGYLGEWNATRAGLSFYNNKLNKTVTYNGLFYVIGTTTPNTAPPTNFNDGVTTQSYIPYNPAGQRIIKTFPITVANSCYNILSLRDAGTQQAYLRMELVSAQGVTQTFIEAQNIDVNLSKIYTLTPNVWYTVNPIKYKSETGATLANRTLFIEVMYVPFDPMTPGSPGDMYVRYRTPYTSTEYPNGIITKVSVISNRDLQPLNTVYVDGIAPTLIDPSATEYGDQFYDSTGLKYTKQVTTDDIEVSTIAKGLILKSPNGTRYRVTVANGGTLTITAL